MGMKKLIYSLFTVEHGIVLNTAVISYIEEKIATYEELMALLSTFKSRFNSSSISKEQIDTILSSKSETKNFYNLKTFKFKCRDFCKEFETFKNQFPIKTTSISLLEDDVESTIFGIFYKNNKSSFSLEDDFDVIDLELEKVHNSAFLFEGMFVGAKGVKNGSFIVQEFILPKMEISKKQNQFLENVKPKICVFKLDELCSNEEILTVLSILASESPDITVIFSKSNIDISLLNKSCKEIIVSSIIDDPDFLPSNSFGVSNPFILETFDSLLGFICVDIFKNRQDGLFFNKNPMDSFIRSFISQRSLYPFGNSDFSLFEFPNILILLKDFHPVVTTVDSVKIVSLSSLKDGYYAVIDLDKNTYEVKNNLLFD